MSSPTSTPSTWAGTARRTCCRFPCYRPGRSRRLPGASPPHPGQRERGEDVSPDDVPRPPRTRLHLGDVVVSVERAIDQAENGVGGQLNDRRWAAADELRLLVTHGVLHVCGWDHDATDEGAAMRALETRVLGIAGGYGSDA